MTDEPRDPVARLVRAARAYRASDVYVEHDGRLVFIGTAMHDADDVFRRPDGDEPVRLLPPARFSLSVRLDARHVRGIARLWGIPPRLLGFPDPPPPWKHPGRRYPRRKR